MKKLQNENGSVELGLALIILAFLLGCWIAVQGFALMMTNVNF